MHAVKGDSRVLNRPGLPIAEMFEIAVRPEAQRRTVASAMALAAINGLALPDDQTLRVRTLADNTMLLDMYQKMGLASTGQEYTDNEGLRIVKLEAPVGLVQPNLEARFTRPTA